MILWGYFFFRTCKKNLECQGDQQKKTTSLQRSMSVSQSQSKLQNNVYVLTIQKDRLNLGK